jgi:hypothetical protein
VSGYPPDQMWTLLAFKDHDEIAGFAPFMRIRWRTGSALPCQSSVYAVPVRRWRLTEIDDPFLVGLINRLQDLGRLRSTGFKLRECLRPLPTAISTDHRVVCTLQRGEDSGARDGLVAEKEEDARGFGFAHHLEEIEFEQRESRESRTPQPYPALSRYSDPAHAAGAARRSSASRSGGGS